MDYKSFEMLHMAKDVEEHKEEECAHQGKETELRRVDSRKPL